MGETDFIPQSAQTLNAGITVSAIIVGLVQLVFIANVIWSIFKGKKSGRNPWQATSLEWQTAQFPPGHGNWGEQVPQVHRWAYDYSVPQVKDDFIPQNFSPEEVEYLVSEHNNTQEKK
jgi:cytochrome c oxidase subunit 1